MDSVASQVPHVSAPGSVDHIFPTPKPPNPTISKLSPPRPHHTKPLTLCRRSPLRLITGIRLFAECSAICRVQFIGHSTKNYLLSATLDELRLSAQTSFAEGRTLGIESHSPKEALPSAKLLAKCDAWHRAVRSRLLLTTINFDECQSLTLGKIYSLPSVLL
jgi:hypothetical protein